MSIDKPSNAEDEYFVKQDAHARRKMATQLSRSLKQHEKDALKAAHWMHCPKCGMTLQSVTFRGVTIEKCFNCNGYFLDQGELERLAGKEHNILHQILAVFEHGEET